MKTLLISLGLIGAAMLAGCSAGEKTDDKAACSANAAIEAIMTRTSVRDYTEEAVSDTDLETLLRAAMAAPTAVNKQPWKFVVINDKTLLKTLSDSMSAWRMAVKAPVAVVVCGDMELALEGDARDFWIDDCSAATENLLVAANALGLGAVWCGIYPIPEKVAFMKDLLKLPDQIIPLCLVPVGHPNGEFQPKDKWKPENISYNAYGQGKPTN